MVSVYLKRGLVGMSRVETVMSGSVANHWLYSSWLYGFRSFVSVFIFILSTHLVSASEQPPVLRINTDLHHQMVNRISTTAGSPYLVSVSDDKTIKLWELPHLRPYRTIRPPIREGHEGRIFAVDSHSPYIAAGGWTQGSFRGFGNYNVYLFDERSGALLHRIGGIENTILHLSFSPDGRYLAAVLHGGNGLRVWRVDDLTEVARDGDYGAESYWVEFSDDGERLVTTSFDGYVRLYDRRFRLLNRTRVGNARNPFAARFSPDGSKIAVGFADQARVSVLSSRTLAPLYDSRPDRDGSGGIFAVAWSADGDYLYGAGYFSRAGRNVISAWANQGRGSPRSWPVATNTIMDLRSMATGELVFAGGAPELGVIDGKTGEILRRLTVKTGDFSNAFPHHFLLSEAGDQVQFTFRGQVPLRFSVAERRLEVVRDTETIDPIEDDLPEDASPIAEAQRILTQLGYDPGAIDGIWGARAQTALELFQRERGLEQTQRLTDDTLEHLREAIAPPPPPAPLNPPKVNSENIIVTQWQNSPRPLLNGHQLPLVGNEISTSYAIARDESGLVLGSSFRLFAYDADGNSRWSRNAPGIVWALNSTTKEHDLFVAAFHDGTIRWYRMSDGSEIMALLVHADQRRWIAWTPNGEYVSSAGGGDLIGWHLHNGWHLAADFFPLYTLRPNFYVEDVLTRALSRVGSQSAGTSATTPGPFAVAARGSTPSTPVVRPPPRQFPPVLQIISPLDGESVEKQEVTIQYQATDRTDEGLSRLTVLLDGRPFERYEGDALRELEGKIVISIPPKDSEIALIGENRQGSSLPVSASLVWKGEETVAGAPVLYAFAAGISDYLSDDIPDLITPGADLLKMVDAFNSLTASEHYDQVVVVSILNADRGAISAQLEWFAENSSHHDVVLLYLSGYMVRTENDDFFLTAEVSHPGADEGISINELDGFLQSIAAKVVLILDVGHFANLGIESATIRPPNIDHLINRLADPLSGVIVLSTTISGQQAITMAESEHSVFAQSFVEVFDSSAADTQSLTLQRLYDQISERMNEYSEGQQTPVLVAPNTINYGNLLIK